MRPCRITLDTPFLFEGFGGCTLAGELLKDSLEICSVPKLLHQGFRQFNSDSLAIHLTRVSERKRDVLGQMVGAIVETIVETILVTMSDSTTVLHGGQLLKQSTMLDFEVNSVLAPDTPLECRCFYVFSSSV